jgi:putative NADH-flavin reductase
MAKVLIIGASKGIGLATVRQALDAGHQVLALARSAPRIPVRHPELERMKGDALDPATVEKALEGVDVVIQTLGVSGGPGILFKPIHLFSDATRVLVAAMEAKLVTRLICVTGLGAGNSRGKGGFLYNAFIGLILVRAYDDKNIQERIIQNSTLDWVIVRPGGLTNGAHTGRYKVLTKPEDWRGGFISRANVADFLVQQIKGDEYLRQTPVLIG